jgi:hypothetical protein
VSAARRGRRARDFAGALVRGALQTQDRAVRPALHGFDGVYSYVRVSGGRGGCGTAREVRDKRP